MTIKRITLSVPEPVAKRIKKAAGATPVSAWVTAVVEEHLEDAELDRQWRAFYQDVCPTAAEVRRADTVFKRLVKRARSKGAA